MFKGTVSFKNICFSSQLLHCFSQDKLGYATVTNNTTYFHYYITVPLFPISWHNKSFFCLSTKSVQVRVTLQGNCFYVGAQQSKLLESYGTTSYLNTCLCDYGGREVKHWRSHASSEKKYLVTWSHNPLATLVTRLSPITKRDRKYSFPRTQEEEKEKYWWPLVLITIAAYQLFDVGQVTLFSEPQFPLL